jgi:predicted nucleic acid-binding protein
MIRAVIDVNVLVSAILGPLGLPRQVILSWSASQFAVVTSEGITEDDLVLATGRLAKADYLVTGDKGLLELEEHERMRIVSPRQFLEILAAQT